MADKPDPSEPIQRTLHSVKAAFDLTGRVAIITGGTGLLGVKHAEAIAEMGGVPVLLDLDEAKAEACAKEISQAYGVKTIGIKTDITRPEQISEALSETLAEFGRVDILINNAAKNPKVTDSGLASRDQTRLEDFPIGQWEEALAVGLTGTFLCSQIIGRELARRRKGVILNIASDLALIGPDQRIYQRPDLGESEQPVKAVSYSVIKSGLIGLTRYLATYWAEKGIRVNALLPGGIYDGQDPAFVERLSQLIPLGRMAHQDEYKAAVIFLVSEASSYMTGGFLVMDGGRTCW